MDLERLGRLHTARSQFVEAANADLPQVREVGAEEMKTRFKDLLTRMERYVDHRELGSVSHDSTSFERHSAIRLVGRFDGPLPNVYVRFGYTFGEDDGTASSCSNGMGFNEFGENINRAWLEWIHYPDGVTAEPGHGRGEYVPVITGFGEVFATESFSYHDVQVAELTEEEGADHEDSLDGFHPAVRLAYLEQSMDQYEAAPPSAYEIREGLAEA
jgi:hypothetical protein